MAEPAIVAEGQAAADRAETVVLPGQTPEGEPVLSVLVKRSYTMTSDGRCARAGTDARLIPGDRHWGDPMSSTIRFESDFVPFKLATDVVLDGSVHAPGGEPTVSCIAALQVEDTRKEIAVFGDRSALYGGDAAAPTITDPASFTVMPLRYERAYGGIDVYSDRMAKYPYPHNVLGQGFIVRNTEAGVKHLALPNLEDPDALLTSERLCVEDYQRWEEQPFPAGFGWFPKTGWERAQLAGILPGDRALESELRHAYAKLVPAREREAYLENGVREMDFRYFNGASRGLAMPYLKGGERVVTENLCAEGICQFRLPDDEPIVGLDIGEGVRQPAVAMHTVMIHMDERRVDLTWRAAVSYPGPDWLPEMRKMEVHIA